MKIAHVVCSFPPNKDGTGNSAYAMVKNLSDKYEVTVFTPSYKKQKSSNQKVNSFCVKRLKPLFRIGNASFLPQLLWRLHGFDIVHLHYPFYGAAEFVCLATMFRKKKIKLIIHYHQDAIGSGFKSLIFKFYKFFVLPILLRQSYAVTCATLSYIKHSELRNYYICHTEKFIETYFGVDLNKKYYNFCRKRLSNTKHQKLKTILFVGGLDRAHNFKGVDVLLKAVKALSQNNSYTCITSSCHLYLKNPSKYPDTLQNFSKKSNINLCAKCKSYFVTEPNLGNALVDSVRDCWNNEFSQKLLNLKFVPKECKSCKYFFKCGGGSRMMAHIHTGSYYGLDPLVDLENIKA